MDGRDLTSMAPSLLRLADVGPQDLIAPNFRVYELTRSETADRWRIDNRFESDIEFRSAVHLARSVLQPIRDAFGPYTPNSVFRGQALERALKNRASSWISTSQHTQGRACDVEVVNMPTLEFAVWASRHLPEFDQIICECHDPRQGPHSGWVHISLQPPGVGFNRRQTLSYVVDKATDRLVYVEGLQPAVA
ncbi:MAG: D-Ala-D-Ala carboxypeptidase family metallohydrolase [Caldimonas sp.]